MFGMSSIYRVTAMFISKNNTNHELSMICAERMFEYCARINIDSRSCIIKHQRITQQNQI